LTTDSFSHESSGDSASHHAYRGRLSVKESPTQLHYLRRGLGPDYWCLSAPNELVILALAIYVKAENARISTNVIGDKSLHTLVEGGATMKASDTSPY